MEDENMRCIAFIILLVTILITTGCISQNSNVVIMPPQTTQVPTIVTTTVPLTLTSRISINNTVTVYYFYGTECPHCDNVKPFIDNLAKKYPQVNFQSLETWHNETNNAFSQQIHQKLAIRYEGVPEVIVVGNTTPLVGDRDIPAYLEGVILEQLNKKSSLKFDDEKKKID